MTFSLLLRETKFAFSKNLDQADAHPQTRRVIQGVPDREVRALIPVDPGRKTTGMLPLAIKPFGSNLCGFLDWWFSTGNQNRPTLLSQEPFALT